MSHFYEVINPSDPVHFRSRTHLAAILAVALVGEGRYGAEEKHEPTGRPKEGAEQFPMFLFGGSNEWAQKNYGKSIEDLIRENRDDIADALDLFFTGSWSEWVDLQAVKSAQTPEMRLAWDDKRRSSLNAISQRAWQIAEGLRDRRILF
jgi:hypothetical protein